MLFCMTFNLDGEKERVSVTKILGDGRYFGIVIDQNTTMMIHWVQP